MKKFSILVITLLFLGLLGGCTAKLDAEKDTVFIHKKGNVTGAIVEEFEKDYYDEKELEAEVEDQIASYNDIAGEDSAKLNKFEVKGGNVRVFIDYKSVDDYAAFNDVTLFSGSVSEAQDAGHDFGAVLMDAKTGNAVDSSEVLKNKDYQVIVLDEQIDVGVPGSIVYFSDNVTSAGDKLASVGKSSDDENDKAEEYQSAGLAFVVFSD